MTTCRTIITRALREIKVIGVGRNPKAAEAEEGLDRLQDVLDGLFGNGAGYPLTDVELDENTDLEADTRYLVFAEGPITVSLPERPNNGARLQIQDVLGVFATYPVTIEATPSNILLTTNSAIYTFVYIADTASWVLVSPLTLDSSIPLGNDEYFILELALSLASVFGAQLSSESTNRLTRARARIRARFEVSKDGNGAEYF